MLPNSSVHVLWWQDWVSADGAELSGGVNVSGACERAAAPRTAHDAAGVLLPFPAAGQQPRPHGSSDGAQHVRGHGYGQR